MSAFRATYSDFKFIKTRDTVQIIFEIPRHDADAVLEILGGMPNPSSERWFGIAPLDPNRAQPQPAPKPPAGAKREKRSWPEIPPAQQAAICVGEPAFSAYLRENHPSEWRDTGDADTCLKYILRIESKKDITADHTTQMAWKQINDHYHAWKTLEHA